MDFILFHNACPDGWAAAFIAKQKYPEAELIALDHGLSQDRIKELLLKCEGKDVLMLDYSFRTREINDEMATLASSFIILDHHKTAQAALEGAPYATFDMNRSGAGLAWDYLLGFDSGITCDVCDNLEPDGHHEGHRPWWVNYVEARDLWRWDSLPNSREICAYLGTLPFEIEAWENLKNINAEQAKELGQGALAHIEHFVRESVKNVQPGVFLNQPVGILNATYLNCSEIGNEIAKMPNTTFSITWFERDFHTIQFSLRSIGELDVSVIAKQFGGGGHRNAAGFQLDYRKGRALVDQVLGRPSLEDRPFGA